MGRGKHFNHKKKGHEPTRPEGSIVHKQRDENREKENEWIVTEEAFKNRVEKE